MNKLIKKTTNKKPMKKDFVFPFVVGIIAGVLIMVFLNFSVRMNNATNALVQLQQATAQNSNTLNDVVNFLNQAAPEATPEAQ